MRCPLCEISLKPAVIQGRSVFRCGICHGVQEGERWFNPGEFENSPPSKESIETRPRSSEVERELALAQVTKLQQQHRERRTPSDSWIQWPALLIGLPVRDAANAPTTWPAATATLILLCVVTAMNSTPQIASQWGFLNTAPWRHGGLTWVTSFFLHEGWWHLLGNMWFLWIFGGNVEEELGRPRYLSLILVAHLLGVLLHWMLPSSVPTLLIGASGGLSAVIAYYVLEFRHHHVSTYWLFRRQHWPAGVWGLMYVILQLFGAGQQFLSKSPGGVAYASHFVGLAVGALAYWQTRRD